MASVIAERKCVYHWKNDTDRRIPKCSNRPVPLRLSPLQTSHRTAWLRTPVSRVKGRRPIAWNIALPKGVLCASHENKTSGKAKWHFRSKNRKEQCVCLSVAHRTAEDRYVYKVLNISWHYSSYSWLSFCLNFYNIFFNLSFMWFTFVFLSTFWRSLIIKRLNWQNLWLKLCVAKASSVAGVRNKFIKAYRNFEKKNPTSFPI